MAARVFALIIGINSYKSGNIWDLTSAVDDATDIMRWLTHDINVPQDQICLLLDGKATKRNIEDQFMNHLVNNSSIERGDAILVYFAGHGSTVPAPLDWFGGKPGDVQVLCSYDHDTRGPEGRIFGISDRSLHAMLHELYQVKGDNITVILDCCFSPIYDRSNHTRWTPTPKAKPADIYANLWKGALGQTAVTAERDGFFHYRKSHITLAACGPSDKAVESKDGGKFTRTLLAVKDKVALHRTTYAQLLEYINSWSGEQRAVCVGKKADRIVFGGIPFIPDARFVTVDLDGDSKLRIGAGSIHGIVEGSEFSFHEHNRRGSLNPVLTTLSVIEIHPTWSLARCRSPNRWFGTKGWARITRWNNRTPFRVYLKRTCTSFFRRRELRGELPRRSGSPPSKGGLNVIRVKNPVHADISVSVGRHDLAVETHDELITGHRIIHVPIQQPKDGADVIDDAARFHLHLHRENPDKPLRNLVTMELYRLDCNTWSRIGGNLLDQGKAQLAHEKGAIYQVILRNESDIDLWPYLACMHANGYGVSMLYLPDHRSPSPPLRKHSQLVIGSGATDSEALSFTLPENETWDAGLLKLFVSSQCVSMSFIEQGAIALVESGLQQSEKESVTMIETVTGRDVWDTVQGVIMVIGQRHMIE